MSTPREAIEEPELERRAPIDVVLLDWGNTLMVDDDDQDGPMVTWKHVAAMPGAHMALRRLRPRHRLVVATNADESSAQDVRAALARVGLDAVVDEVASSHDVGACKPDPAFFHAALGAASTGQRRRREALSW